jgi:hypothetical protein
MLLSATSPRPPLLGIPSLLVLPAAGLLLGYLYALITRPEVPEHFKSSDRQYLG